MKRKINVKQFIRYTLIGSFTTIIDIALVWFLLNQFTWSYLISLTLAFVTATFIHYALNRTLNYRETKRLFSKGAGYFLSINVFGLVLILMLTAFCVEIVGLTPFMSRVIVAPLVGIASYILNTKITFKANLLKNNEKKYN